MHFPLIVVPNPSPWLREHGLDRQQVFHGTGLKIPRCGLISGIRRPSNWNPGAKSLAVRPSRSSVNCRMRANAANRIAVSLSMSVLRLAGQFTHPCVRPALATQRRDSESPHGLPSVATSMWQVDAQITPFVRVSAHHSFPSSAHSAAIPKQMNCAMTTTPCDTSASPLLLTTATTVPITKIPR